MKPKSLIKKEKFIYLLLTSSLFLLLLSIVQTDLGASQPSAYWYASSLPITFYIGLVLSACTLLISYKHTWPVRILSIILPVLYLYAIPAYAHDLPPVYDIYHVIPIPLEILETGHHNIEEYYFPLSHIFWANNLEVLDTEPLTYARLFPTIFASSIALSIYSTSRKLSKKWASAAPLAFLSMYWYMEAHMARQSFTLILWTLFILTLFSYLYTKDIKLAAITIFVALSILLSHPGQTIFLFFNLAALSFVSLLFIMNEEIWDHLKPIHLITGAAAISFFVIYYSVAEIQELFKDLYERLGERGLEEGMDLGYRIESSESYALANSIRAVKMFSQSLLGLSAALTAYVKRSRRAITVSVIFLSCYLWLIYPLTHHGRYLERAFMAALIPASLLITYLLAKMETIDHDRLKAGLKTLTVIFLIALLLTVPITKNSIDSFETPSRPGLKAGRFAQQNYNDTVYVTDTHEGLFRYIEAKERSEVRFTSVSGGPVERADGVKTGYKKPNTASVRDNQLFLDYYKNYFSVRFGNETVVEEIENHETRHASRQARVYDSGGARFYTDS